MKKVSFKREFKFSLFMPLIFLLLFGCSGNRLNIKSERERFENRISENWDEAADISNAIISNSFTELIDDPELDLLVEEALTNNQNLRASAFRLAAIRKNLTSDKALLWPQIYGEASINRHNQGINDYGQSVLRTNHGLTLTSSWEIDIWRKLADANKASFAFSESSANEYQSARDALGARVIQIWVQIITTKQSLEIETERLKIFEQLEAIILRRYRQGISSLEDLSAVRSNIEFTKVSIESTNQNINELTRTLELLVGRIPQADLLTSKTLPRVTATQEGFPLSVIINRPDVASALWRLEAADAAASASAKELLPGVRITGSVGQDKNELEDLLSGKTLWNVAGSLTQPIFQRGSLVAKKDAADYELMAAWEEYQAAVLGAIGEIESAMNLERSLVVQRDHLLKAQEESSNNANIFERRYRKGLVSILEYLQARNQEMDVNKQVVVFDGEILSNRVNLALAVGTGFKEYKDEK